MVLKWERSRVAMNCDCGASERRGCGKVVVSASARPRGIQSTVGPNLK